MLQRLSETPGIELERGLQLYASNTDRYIHLLRLQHKLASEQIDSIKRSLAQGDKMTAANIAHELKGSAGNLGLTALFQAAAALNVRLQETHCDEPHIQGLLASLDTAFRDLNNVLD